MRAGYSPTQGAASRSTPSAAYDAFSILATSKSRSNTPSIVARPSTGHSPAPANVGSVDAFSSLLGPSFASTAGSGSSMSLADRQTAALKEQQAKDDRIAKENESAVWSGLDMLGQGTSGLIENSVTSKSSSLVSEDDWLFDKVAPPAAASTSKTSSPVHAEDYWDLSDFSSQSHSAEKPQPQINSLDSLSLFDSLGDSSHDGDLLSDTYGERRPQPTLNAYNDDAEDDILGMLARPVESMPKRRTPTEPVSRAPPQERSTSRARTTSPPPHVIGQIVEMGFSPEQVRLALAATDSGLDVQQALEMLLSNVVGAEDQPDSPPVGPRSRGLAEFQDEESRRPEAPRVREDRRQTSSSSATSSRRQNQSPSLVPDDIQEKADRLLAQASEIGLTMFNRANAFWKDGKEKVQKAYEERAVKTKPASDRRPRWMSEVSDDHVDQNQRSEAFSGIPAQRGFRDGDVGRPSLNHSHRTEAMPNESERERPALQAPDDKPANLLSTRPAVYISPARRRPVPSRTTSQVAPSTAPEQSSAPRQISSMPMMQTRKTVPASASTIAASNSHKNKGTELFKLGQYVDAEKSYSTAMAALPTKHLLLVPLYNNRALTRIKTGYHNGAVEDCTTVISIIGTDYHPAREAKVSREEEGASVDLADALLKAYRRRAEACEGQEKWELAQKDWEAIVSCEWSAKMRKDALSGASRCRKMITVDRDPPPKRTQPVSRPAVRSVTFTQDVEAVQKLRRANQALEEEEQMKAGLKDTVDAKLNAWKGGKETNVRALVASLDTILWPGLGWQKVGLHELVSPSQVKIRYMKAIAKLHPDKLSASNTTVEQRMVANGVFAALNDAWIAFKQ